MTPTELARSMRNLEVHLGLRSDERPELIAQVLAGADAGRLERGDPDELRRLAPQLVVGETYFFRHAEQLRRTPTIVARVARPRCACCRPGARRARSRTRSRCSRARGARRQRSHAIDFNPAALERAARATLLAVVAARDAGRAWSSAGFARPRRSRSSRRSATPSRFTRATSRATASCGRASRWDVVFCRNVMMYFSPSAARAPRSRGSRRALAPGRLPVPRPRRDAARASRPTSSCVTRTARSTTGAAARPSRHNRVDRRLGRRHPRRDRSASRRSSPPRSHRVPARPRAIRCADVARAPRRRAVRARARRARSPRRHLPRRRALLRALVALAQAGHLADAEATAARAARGACTAPRAHYAARAVPRQPPATRPARAHHARTRSRARAEVRDGAHPARLPRAARRRRRDRDRRARARDRAARARGSRARLALFGGGFARAALVELCRAELAARGGAR